ncbi:unnamed protein product, partial [Mesorhabditis belari]|uniref:Gustatory receptor n=1 Tax=Mesorhabditis belari TaxID=2138241 RepID=A0AAF3EIP1_9BILA
MFNNGTKEANICNVWADFINYFTAGIYVFPIIFFVILLLLIVSLRRAFHPFFSILFLLFLSIYIACDAIYLPYKLSSVINENSRLSNTLCAITDFTYFLITPLGTYCTVERIVATILFRSYERQRHWAFFLVTFPICVLFACAMAFQYVNDEKFSEIVDQSLVFFSVFNILSLIILYLINRYFIRKCSHANFSNLSMRYQLAENVKAVYLLLPILFLDNLITINDMIWYGVAQIDSYFDPWYCKRIDGYFVFYIIGTTISFLLELSMPIVVLARHELLRKKIQQITRKVMLKFPRKSSTTIIPISPSSRSVKLKNVFGDEIVKEISISEYFDRLKAQW